MDHHTGLESAWDNVKPAWNRFRTAFVKRYGRLTFVCVLEPQPHSGFPHLHVLIDRFIPWGWLKVELINAGFGYVKDVSCIRSDAAYNYVLKYLRKPWESTPGAIAAIERNLRRFSSSRGLLAQEKPKPSWTTYNFLLSEEVLIDFLRIWSAKGGEFHVLTENHSSIAYSDGTIAAFIANTGGPVTVGNTFPRTAIAIGFALAGRGCLG
jgi:hypothetical protein